MASIVITVNNMEVRDNVPTTVTASEVARILRVIASEFECDHKLQAPRDPGGHLVGKIEVIE